MPAISRRAVVSVQPLAERLQERAEIAMPRVLERQTVRAACPPACTQRERVEHADRARVVVEQLAEVRLAQPAVDARAHLDAQAPRDSLRAAEPGREVDLSEAPSAEEPIDPRPAARSRRWQRISGDTRRRRASPGARAFAVAVRVMAAVAPVFQIMSVDGSANRQQPAPVRRDGASRVSRGREHPSPLGYQPRALPLISRQSLWLVASISQHAPRA